MLKSLKKSLKGSLAKVNIPCFGINKKKFQIPEKKAEVERKSKPLWQWFEESPNEYDCSEVVTCEDLSAEKTQEEITEFHSGEKDLEIPSSSTVNFSICCSNPPLPTTELCGGSLFLNSSCHATTHCSGYIKGATSNAKSCLDWACSAVSCGGFIQCRPFSKQQNPRLPRNSMEPTHPITKLRLESPYSDSRNESVVDDIIDFSMGNNEATLEENEASFEVRRASFMIDEDDIEFFFEEDESYENFQAPKFYDFENQYVDNDSEAWFCNPECGHFKKAEDILQLESDGESFCKSLEETRPISVLESCMDDTNDPTCSNMKKEDATIAENREEIEYAIDMIYQEIKQWIYMKEEKALTAAHRKEIEDTLEILYQDLKVWTDKKEKEARIAAHREEIEDTSETLYQELKVWTDKKEKEARIAAHRKEIEDTSEILYQELKVWTDKKEKEARIEVLRTESENPIEIHYQDIKHHTDMKEDEALIAAHKREIEGTIEILYRTSTESVRAKLGVRKRKYLTKGGRSDLKHLTLQAIPIYMLSLVVIPKSVMKELEKIVRRSLWGTCNDKMRVLLVRWKENGTPLKNGGLGLRKLGLVNLSLLAKWWHSSTKRPIRSRLPLLREARKSKPLWQWFEESSYEYDCSEVVTFEDLSEEKTQEEITELHSDEKDLEIPSSATINFSICFSNPPLPTTESCGGSLSLNSSRHATTHRFRYIRGATSNAKSCLDWACSAVSCGGFIQCRPFSKQQKSRNPRNSMKPTHPITKLRLKSPYADSRNESIVDDIINFSMGNNEATFVDNASEAWFCNPECGHFKKAEDILQLENDGESFYKSPEETSPKSVLESCMQDTNDPTCSNMKKEDAPIAENREEIEYAIDMIYQEIKQWVYMKEEKALTAAHRKEIEDTLEILYQELQVWTDKKEAAHRKEIEDTIEIPYQDIKHHTDMKEDEALIAAHKKGTEMLYQTSTERFRAKLRIRKREYLTKGSRSVLISLTLQAIPIYMLSLVVIPKGIMKELEKTVRRSLWRTCNDKMRVLLVSWKKNGTPLKNRGLGLRKLGLVNLSLLAKWCHSSIKRPIRSRLQFKPFKEAFPLSFALSDKKSGSVIGFMYLFEDQFGWNLQFRREADGMELNEVTSLLRLLETVSFKPEFVASTHSSGKSKNGTLQKKAMTTGVSLSLNTTLQLEDKDTLEDEIDEPSQSSFKAMWKLMENLMSRAWTMIKFIGFVMRNALQ